MAADGNLQALILAGGSGTRFWPVSRRHRPKQLLALDSDQTLLQRTTSRLQPLIPADRVWVCTTRELAPAVREQLPDVPPDQILAEPTGRDTAPAIAWSVRTMGRDGGDPIVAVLPADHRVEDDAAFRAGLASAAAEVDRFDRVMTLGISPHRVETGYGYLEQGEILNDEDGIREVRRFIEKPDRETAVRFVESGDYLWNAGIFVFRSGRLLELVARLQPQMAATLERIETRPEEIEELYGALRRISIDYAVMEQCDDLATLPLDCGWSDLGSWEALAEVVASDGSGNAIRGEVVMEEASGNLLFADDGLIAAVGVSDLVIVRTADVVLVMPKSRAQEVKTVVEALHDRGRDDLL
jgi:mannose-1-phosphate guanylyltransferase/mannose-6-phosphate isomerase